jgi:hypothetical protein
MDTWQIIVTSIIIFYIAFFTQYLFLGCSILEFIENKKIEAENQAFQAWKLGFIAPGKLAYINAIASQPFYLFEVATWERVQVFHHVDEEWYDIGAHALRGYVKINKEGVIGLSKGRHLVESKCRIMIRVNEGGPCYILDPSLKEGERNTWHERYKPYRVERRFQRQQWPNRWGGTSI